MRRALNRTSKFQDLEFCGADHLLTEVSKQLLLIGVAVDGQKRRPVPVEVEHARLLLYREDNWLHGHRGKVRHNCTQLLEHGFGIRNIGNYEPRHPSKQRDRLVRIAAPGLLEVK